MLRFAESWKKVWVEPSGQLTFAYVEAEPAKSAWQIRYESEALPGEKFVEFISRVSPKVDYYALGESLQRGKSRKGSSSPWTQERKWSNRLRLLYGRAFKKFSLPGMASEFAAQCIAVKPDYFGVCAIG